MSNQQPRSTRVLIGALSGLLPALGFGLIAMVREPVGGYSMGAKVASGWMLASAYVALGLVAGAVVGAARPLLTSARRAALLGTAIAVLPLGLVLAWSQDDLGLGGLLVWTLGLALVVGGSIGGSMYWMIRAFDSDPNSSAP